MLTQRGFWLERRLLIRGLQLAGLNIALSIIGLLVPFGGGPLIAQVIPPPFVSFTGAILFFFIPLWGGVGLALSAFFGLRLAKMGIQWREASLVGLIGGIPFFGLSLLGYAFVGYILLQILLGSPDPAGMLPTGIMVFGILATLLLLAGIVSASAVVLSNVLSQRRGTVVQAG